MGIEREDYNFLLNRQRPLKYKNIPTEIDGIRFASKKEARRYCELKLLLKQGAINDLELQPKFDFPMGFSYKADFRYKDPNGRVIVEDVKGIKTDVFKLKEKCLLYFYKDIDFRLI